MSIIRSVMYLIMIALNSYSAHANTNMQQQYLEAQRLLDSQQIQSAITSLESMLASDESFGDASVLLFQAKYILGEYDSAMKFGLNTYQKSVPVYAPRMKSWFRHSLLGALMYQNQLQKAEELILGEFPQIKDLPEKSITPRSLDLGVPLHTTIAYIHILRATNRDTTANQIAAHLSGIAAQPFFGVEEVDLGAAHSWMLASIWSVQPNKADDCVRLLNQAFDNGFKQGWHFNYKYHPVYWSLRTHPEFQRLMSKIAMIKLQKS